MKGDKLVLQDYHKRAASEIVPHIIQNIRKKKNRYVITVAGESGSGKSETGKAIADELGRFGLKSILFFHPSRMI
jgi:ABC-type dipeptide/oligopeptide/nickel transport system ATPase component